MYKFIIDMDDSPKALAMTAHAAAICYSLVTLCKANRVYALSYLTYVLSNARNKDLVLPTSDEFAVLNAYPADALFSNFAYDRSRARRQFADGFEEGRERDASGDSEYHPCPEESLPYSALPCQDAES